MRERQVVDYLTINLTKLIDVNIKILSYLEEENPERYEPNESMWGHHCCLLCGLKGPGCIDRKSREKIYCCSLNEQNLMKNHHDNTCFISIYRMMKERYFWFLPKQLENNTVSHTVFCSMECMNITHKKAFPKLYQMNKSEVIEKMVFYNIQKTNLEGLNDFREGLSCLPQFRLYSLFRTYRRIYGDDPYDASPELLEKIVNLVN
jgi:hypothetical protein